MTSVAVMLCSIACTSTGFSAELRRTANADDGASVVEEILALKDTQRYKRAVRVTTVHGKTFRGFLEPQGEASTGRRELTLRTTPDTATGALKKVVRIEWKDVATVRIQRQRSKWTNITWVALGGTYAAAFLLQSDAMGVVAIGIFATSVIYHVYLAIVPAFHTVTIAPGAGNSGSAGSESGGSGCS